MATAESTILPGISYFYLPVIACFHQVSFAYRYGSRRRMADSKKRDDNNNNNPEVAVRSPRIVSLLPSITELVACLGAGDHIVGITHECDFPLSVVNRTASTSTSTLPPPVVVTTSDISPYTMTQEEIHTAVCGSLKNGHSLYGLRSDLLKSTRPDIIFTQSLCDVCAVSYGVVVETCAKMVGTPPPTDEDQDNSHDDDNNFNPKIISLEPSNLQDVFVTLRVAADAMGPPFVDRAVTAIDGLRCDIETIRRIVATAAGGRHRRRPPRVAFLEWHSPFFCGGHWIADMMQVAGAHYDMCPSGKRSFAITDEELSEYDPDYVLIGPCGFSLEQSLKDTRELLYGVGKKKENATDDQQKSHYQRVEWWKSLRAVQEGNVFCLDGNGYYARPGPRLVQGAGIIAACIHGTEVAQELGERLAPSAAYHRIIPEDLC
mmetsp:Transcript_14294/g.34517  ORF Transcript_14294/g.34517 Transcript_14294/m.34517 type:complete len:432 (+) Transcript_14294:113-1408(+)|eukprot:CAMPEP_0113444520 /NCGR_PEP_ID=MMETSP0014_2-20120614/2707_1 /TAXON_ID=2857 /ORGANISM="Nitzschia sp." /LENGTH=431 /DNA_ID=CAMNT_0000335531 /DNA_START=16 /DNA_END=1311 /DNA_ORIENTATION=- /assembly_acc=CAM_ASM_000159